MKVYTLDEVAEVLKLKKVTLYNYIRSGKLPAAKFGRDYRVTEEDLRVFIEGAKTRTKKNKDSKEV
ncbi:helix-turn-helix domain-containing protein [Pelotomaculum isophthalicicum JI]|uniref:Helix-turn-helix domain-containing protein n=1 Tax=Pelotomaculum isophthalicicum JI TaxID=947010 RepID=A0A9X4JWN8_9FIRM|nr:helix-turn-helix domain-containing protein [Pelotomaculum isophthalicicum]MDF9409553.1 helix-turn-helix domain-containing protein [Pelotomaculum isophthalicicum JI]